MGIPGRGVVRVYNTDGENLVQEDEIPIPDGFGGSEGSQHRGLDWEGHQLALNHDEAVTDAAILCAVMR